MPIANACRDTSTKSINRTRWEVLAAKLGIKSRELSQLANARYRMTFPALLNSWRLDEAARLLADATNANPVTTIMYDAGFGSKSSFQREFHKKFGKSPSAYRAAFDVDEKRSILT